MAKSEQKTSSKAHRFFDSLSFAKRMESVGFTRQQAEALAEEQGNLIDERLATKDDVDKVSTEIERLRSETSTNIERLRSETKVDIELLRRDVTIRIGSMIVALGGILIAVKYFG